MQTDKSILKRTKILATVGPATNSHEKLAAIISGGANGLRMNFSHGDYPERDQQITWIREIAADIGRNVAILQDLQGPKIRLGMLKDDRPLAVKTGDELELTYGIEHDGGRNVPTQYDLAKKVEVDEPLYIFDGKIRTKIIDIYGATVKVKVENDGELMSKKGINLPLTDFGGDVLTEKDLRDIDYGAKQDFDYVSLSFVQKASDVENLRSILRDKGSTAKVIAKIESPVAIRSENLEEIVKASDGVMVARGDLATEAGDAIVPIVQRKIIELCQKHAKFTIVATQMMASMVENPTPTRAEVSDVANAAIQGADVVMLSDETANGDYPVETVKAMRDILLEVQKELPVKPIYHREESIDKRRDAIAASSVVLADQLHADAIIVETRTGTMARAIAIHRPNVPILAVTDSQRVANQMSLIYSTRGFVMNACEDCSRDLAETLNKQDFFGPEPTTVIVVKSGESGFEGGVADTIRVKQL